MLAAACRTRRTGGKSAALGMAIPSATDSVYTPSTGDVGSEPSACKQCGTPFPRRPRGRNGKFCSDRCRGLWHRAQKAARLSELEELLTRASALARELREA